MKVRISYGVELEEVPSKITDLVNQASAELESLAADLRSAAGMLPVDNSIMQGGAVQMIDHVRMKIGDVDATLNDAHSIMSGYINAMEDQASPPVPEAPTAPLPPPVAAPTVPDVAPVPVVKESGDV